MKRKVSLFLCIVLGLMMLTSCGGQEQTAGNDPNEQVALKWVTRGPGKLEDADRVWEAYNKKLAEYLPNTTVEFQMIPSADYAEKWRLMSAAQETVDVAWISFNQNFVSEVGKGSYMDITDLVNEYGSEMKEGFPDWLLDLTTVNGRIYAVPNYQMMAFPYGFGVPQEHIDKGWIDMEKVEEIYCSGDPITKDDFKIVEDYLTKVAENGEKVKYVAKRFLDEGLRRKIGIPYMGLEELLCNAAILRNGDDYKVYDMLTDFPENYAYYDLINEWHKKGFIRSDILEKTNETAADYLLWGEQNFIGVENRLSVKTGRDMKVFQSNNWKYVPFNGSSTNTAIAASSKHPERAMQLINLMNCKRGSELLNLICFGFEGEHYEKVEGKDNRIKWLGAETVGSSNNKYGYETWAIGNALCAYETDADPDGWNKYCEEEINQKAEVSRVAGFSLDTKPIQLEIAQYNAKMKEYEYLYYGETENYKELLEERNAALKEAGSEKIVAEVQRQIDEWLKTKQ